MMNSEISSKANVSSESAVALPISSGGYGVASGVHTVSIDRTGNPALGMGQYASYYYGEYFKGIMFLLATTMFILVVPVFLARPARLRAMLSRVVKRSIDIVGSLVGIILTLPVWIILPILIKLDSRGPVFYVQTRVGRNRRQRDRRYCQRTDVDDHRKRSRRRVNANGVPFSVFKFRTMVDKAEARSGPVWATANDPRVTNLGAILRKTRLDEIPQFINVFLGQMSLVGPRPERPNFVEKYSARFDDYVGRLNVKPGLTGLAQVESGYDSSDESVRIKLEHDLMYINTWSLWLDIKILCRTVIVVLTGRGAC